MPVSSCTILIPPFLILLSVDIKELKLLGEFHHPNIVRFVSKLHSVNRISNSSATSWVSVYLKIPRRLQS